MQISVLPLASTSCTILQTHEHTAITLQLRVSKHDNTYSCAVQMELPAMFIYMRKGDIYL